MKKFFYQTTLWLFLLGNFFPLWITHYTFYHKWLLDDVYITLTFAKCIARGQGFIFNHPPPVLGTTSPLLALIIASLSKVLPFASIPQIAVFFSSVCWIGIGWVFLLFRKSFGIQLWQAAVIGLCILSSGWVQFLGMEAYLFALLLVLSIALLYAGFFISSGVTAGLLFLTRGEGILIVAILIGYSFIREYLAEKKLAVSTGVPALKVCVGCCVPLIVWAVYALYNFGNIFPNTLAAKIAQVQSGIWKPFQHYLINQWIFDWGKEFKFGEQFFLNIWWYLVVAGFCYAVKQKRKFLILLVWVIFYCGGYILLKIPGYGQYQLPIVFVLQLFFALGIIACVNGIITLKKTKMPAVIAGIIFIGFFIFTSGYQTVRMTYDDTESLYSLRPKWYLNLAEWFKKNAHPAESIAYIEIGHLGYFTDNKIIDLAGLITPDIVPHVAKRDFASGFEQHKPDYFIYNAVFGWALESVRYTPEFKKHYVPVYQPEYTYITVYKRK